MPKAKPKADELSPLIRAMAEWCVDDDLAEHDGLLAFLGGGVVDLVMVHPTTSRHLTSSMTMVR